MTFHFEMKINFLKSWETDQRIENKKLFEKAPVRCGIKFFILKK